MQYKNCAYCGDQIYDITGRKRYCSKNCSDKGRRYGGLRYDVLKRDNFKCTKCGVSIDLHVHHIDEDVKHNEMDNLLTLCQSCHKSHHHTGYRNTKYKHVTKEQIENAIKATSSLEEASKLIGITRSNLRRKRMDYGMEQMPNARKGKENPQYIELSLGEIEMALELEGNWEDASKRLGVSRSVVQDRYKKSTGRDSLGRLGKEFTREQILEAYEKGGNWKEASILLGITKKTMLAKRKLFGL